MKQLRPLHFVSLLILFATGGLTTLTYAVEESSAIKSTFLISQAQIQTKASFPDLSGYEWASVEINALADRGIIKGFPDGTFRPGDLVTRAQFAAMLKQAFGSRQAIRTARDFPDVRPNYWARDAIRTVYALGFINGYPNGDFQPEGNIRRVEAVTALSTGLNLEGRINLGNVYTDAGQICGEGASFAWACNQISSATYNGILVKPASNQNNSQSFNPGQFATRADIAVFIYQALQHHPVSGVITQLDNSGGSITLRGNVASLNDELFDPAHRLRVPRRSIANMGFRPSIGGGTIPKFLVQAGSSTAARTTEYWYPCRGTIGTFLIGWSDGTESSCETVHLETTLKLPLKSGLSSPRSIEKQFAETQAKVSVSPVTSETTWVLADVADNQVIVSVLGGTVEVSFGGELQRVSALNQYTLQWDTTGDYQENVEPLSALELQAVASSTDVADFVRPNNWSPEIAPQLSQYELYRDAILERNINAQPPDLAAQSIEFSLSERTSQFSGRVAIVGTVSNVGQGPFWSSPGQQQAQLYEVPLGGTPRLVASQSFQNLAPGETVDVIYQRDWNSASPAEGEFPPSYRLIIAYDPDISLDGNPNNDDSNSNNNRIERTGTDMNIILQQP